MLLWSWTFCLFVCVDKRENLQFVHSMGLGWFSSPFFQFYILMYRYILDVFVFCLHFKHIVNLCLIREKIYLENFHLLIMWFVNVGGGTSWDSGGVAMWVFSEIYMYIYICFYIHLIYNQYLFSNEVTRVSHLFSKLLKKKIMNPMVYIQLNNACAFSKIWIFWSENLYPMSCWSSLNLSSY